MREDNISSIIASELGIKVHQVEMTINLLDEGNTVPFIARYRKEKTGELNEEYIRSIEERVTYLRNVCKRQQEILAAIAEQGNLTEELQEKIINAKVLQELEDLYLPYRPKKYTRAQKAREKGLEPLAEIILSQDPSIKSLADVITPFVCPDKNVENIEDAISGAQDIIAENMSEQIEIRTLLRKRLWNQAQLAAQLAVSEDEGKDFLAYKEYSEPICHIPSHRILALNRGEKQLMLRVQVNTDHDSNIKIIAEKFIKAPSIFSNIIYDAIQDGYKRLLFPSLEREIRNQLTENAEKQAIQVFGRNLRQLLLQAPLSGFNVMGLDPGYRTGCKLAVVDQTGKVLATDTLYITHSDDARQAAIEKCLKYIKTHNVNLISIGNGTASYETEEFVSNLINNNHLNIHYLIVNEAGASVYSASKLAKEELPELDVSLRGAVSIARRIQDPLAELVKIDPKSIGVGQYQHDVNQKELAEALKIVVESCVNHVGVELNTASAALLTHVAGITASVAKNIVAYRQLNGSFSSRQQLLKVSRLGPSTFTQCAGFLRIKDALNPLDNTPVHPESYELAEKILAAFGFSLQDLTDKNKLAFIAQHITLLDTKKFAAELNAGEPTVRDILSALTKPGRDPREDLPPPLTRKNIMKLSDLAAGSIVTGTVQNVTDFGAFVDIGLKTTGLIHRSELSYAKFRHPLDIVNVGDIIKCVILSVDENRNRIALSLKQAKNK